MTTIAARQSAYQGLLRATGKIDAFGRSTSTPRVLSAVEQALVRMGVDLSSTISPAFMTKNSTQLNVDPRDIGIKGINYNASPYGGLARSYVQNGRTAVPLAQVAKMVGQQWYNGYDLTPSSTDVPLRLFAKDANEKGIFGSLADAAKAASGWDFYNNRARALPVAKGQKVDMSQTMGTALNHTAIQSFLSGKQRQVVAPTKYEGMSDFMDWNKFMDYGLGQFSSKMNDGTEIKGRELFKYAPTEQILSVYDQIDRAYDDYIGQYKAAGDTYVSGQNQQLWNQQNGFASAEQMQAQSAAPTGTINSDITSQGTATSAPISAWGSSLSAPGYGDYLAQRRQAGTSGVFKA